MIPEPAKYAHPECERRFVLAAVPSDATDPRDILDLYVIGTRLRVRSVTTEAGITYKLGQKIRPVADDPTVIMHTSLYLSQDEYDVLASLPWQRLRKTRRSVALAGTILSVDAFHDTLDGLVLAEVDLGSNDVELGEFEPPDYYIAEVSEDERFTGGKLAITDRATVDAALEAVSGLRLPS